MRGWEVGFMALGWVVLGAEIPLWRCVLSFALFMTGMEFWLIKKQSCRDSEKEK